MKHITKLFALAILFAVACVPPAPVEDDNSTTVRDSIVRDSLYKDSIDKLPKQDTLFHND